MKRIFVLLLCIAILIPLCSCAVSENTDAIMFSKQKKQIEGTAVISSKGVVFDSSARTPTFTYTPEAPIGIYKKGIFELCLKNTTDKTSVEVSFITTQDPEWTAFKKFDLPIEPCEDFKSFSIDLSKTYGWLTEITGLRFKVKDISQGEIVIRSFEIKDGGEYYLENIEYSPQEVYLSRTERMRKGIIGPDGILGIWKNKNGQLSFLACSDGKPMVTHGTPESPFEKVISSNGYIENMDWVEYRYCSPNQIVKNPNNDELIGITHLERNLLGGCYVATIGLSVSEDDGETWTFLGEIICQDVPIDQHPNVSRDIGNGTILMDDEYLYIFIADVEEETLAHGLAVCRVNLKELYETTAKKELPKAHKYKDGKWDEPGWEGKFDNILPEGIVPNFHYLTYNTELEKYIMVLCCSPYYTSNDGDIMMLVSDTLYDFRNAKYNYLSTAKAGEQYPTIVSLEGDQLKTGKEFYVYFCSWNAFDENGVSNWQLLWGSAQYVRHKITISK